MLILGHKKCRLRDGISMTEDTIIKDKLIDRINLATVTAKANLVRVVETKVFVK